MHRLLGTSRHLLCLLCLLPLLASCGGGLSTFEPVVSSVRAQSLQYGRQASILVAGEYLNNAITIETGEGCTNPGFSPGSSVSRAVITCTVRVAGSLPLALRSAAGALLFQTTLQVPLPQVSLLTSKGSITLELDPQRAPVTVDNFLDYVSSGYYAGTLFHRVIPGFVVQGGGFAGGFADGLSPKPGLKESIPLESDNGLSNLRGTLAMARTNEPDSATSQFFINLSDNLQLDRKDAANPGYAVFGKVVDGLAVVDDIAAQTTGVSSGLQDVPTTDISITLALRVR